MPKNVKPAAAPTTKVIKAKKVKPGTNGEVKPAKTPAPKIDLGVNKPQLRILRVLAGAAGPLDRRTIAERANVALTWVSGFLVKAGTANTTKALAEQGLATAKNVTDDSGIRECWVISAAGKKLIVQADKTGK